MKFKSKFVLILLSISIFIFSLFQYDFTVYASSAADLAAHLPEWDELSEFDKWVMIVEMCGVNVRAFWKGDYEAILNNIKAVSDYADGDPLDSGAITVTNDGIVLSEDLVSVIKQALKEYAEESCGFWIMPTVDFRLLSGVNFISGPIYYSLKNIVNEKEIVVFGARGSSGVCRVLQLADIYSVDIPMVYICTSSTYDPDSLSNSVGCPVMFYGAETWNMCNIRNYEKGSFADNSAVTSFDEFKEIAGRPSLTADQNLKYFYVNLTAPFSNLYETSSRFMLISKDGRRVKVYKSLNAYKYADTNTRPIYFGSGFYDDVGEVKVSFDDLQGYLDGKYDSFFDDLKALLPDNDSSLSEDEIEKIVDKLLGQLGEVGDKVDNVDGSLKETNSILEKIASTLSSYFEAVLAYLDGILTSIQGLIFVETVKPDDDHKDLSDMIDSLYTDPQTGSQAVADSLSASFSDIGSALMAKFPFCIPHDLYSLLNVFSNIPESRAAPMALDDDGIQAYAEASAAPRFELPLMVESLGIEEIIVIDMSDFTPISKNSRTFLSLLLAVSLMKFTAVVVGLINDAFG